jgi:hypothetical protein
VFVRRVRHPADQRQKDLDQQRLPHLLLCRLGNPIQEEAAGARRAEALVRSVAAQREPFFDVPDRAELLALPKGKADRAGHFDGPVRDARQWRRAGGDAGDELVVIGQPPEPAGWNADGIGRTGLQPNRLHPTTPVLKPHSASENHKKCKNPRVFRGFSES